MANAIKPLSRLLLLGIISGLCLPVVTNCSVFNDVYAPSAPEFTLDFVESPYSVPPTYAIDQYTGKNVTDQPGYTVENKSIVVTIKNQEIRYSSFYDGTKYYMAYEVAVKGHYGEAWKILHFDRTCPITEYLSEDFPKASNSDYTVLYVPVDNYPVDAQLDVKLQAYIGHEAVVQVIDRPAGLFGYVPADTHDEDGIKFDTAGEWSEIQTITLNTPHPETDQLNLILTGVLIMIPIVAGLGLLIYISKRKHSN